MTSSSKRSSSSVPLLSVALLLIILVQLVSSQAQSSSPEVRARSHKAMRIKNEVISSNSTATSSSDLIKEGAKDTTIHYSDNDGDTNYASNDEPATANDNDGQTPPEITSPNYYVHFVATTPKIEKSNETLSRYEQGLEDYEEAAQRVELEEQQKLEQQEQQLQQQQSSTQFGSVVQPFLRLFNVLSGALSSSRAVRMVGPDPSWALSAFGLNRKRKGDDGNYALKDKNVFRRRSTGNGADDDDDDDTTTDASSGDNDSDNLNAEQHSTAMVPAAVEQGRYIKGDPLNGYYDFVISEGSYKFWAVFQVATALLIIYSTFAAIYYSKVSPLTSDYDYIDYLNGGRSFAGGRAMDQARTASTSTSTTNAWDGLLNKPWFNFAAQSFAFVMDAIEKAPK
ncbi:uncharacterized protein LOC129747798 [Uranotaenia lowii]|uniref:uncharacterized protein LOC129747798 n=1 Tax=Uranotaenia lowii TaxID=190385 RepID=UPI00247A679B|nr:uncharacterized protein LOC129747798 [Uranotaenia lowii]